MIHDLRSYLQSHLSLQSLLDADPSLNLGFSSFDLRHNLLDVCHFVFSFPEDSGVGAYFLGCLAFNILADVVHIITTVFLASLDKLVEFTLGPVCEALDLKRSREIKGYKVFCIFQITLVDCTFFTRGIRCGPLNF